MILYCFNVILDLKPPPTSICLFLGVLVIRWRLKLIILSPGVAQNNLPACRRSHYKPARWQSYPPDVGALSRKWARSLEQESLEIHHPHVVSTGQTVYSDIILQIPAVSMMHSNGSVILSSEGNNDIQYCMYQNVFGLHFCATSW